MAKSEKARTAESVAQDLVFAEKALLFFLSPYVWGNEMYTHLAMVLGRCLRYYF
jgi:hypothetical protein